MFIRTSGTIFFAVLLTVELSNAAYYVSPTGSGSTDGSSWANAFSNVQAGVNACAVGETLYLKYGVYTNTVSVVISNKPSFFIKGGYEGVGSPGNITNVSTVITRDPAANIRIIYGYASTVTVDNVTISGGKLMDKGSIGGGIYLQNCITIIRNSTVISNAIEVAVNGDENLAEYGGAIYASGGTLLISNALFVGNYNYNPGIGQSAYHTPGGAVYGSGIGLTVYDSVFSNNYSRCSAWLGKWEWGVGSEGGAFYLSGGTAFFSNTVFYGNSVSAESSTRGRRSLGGACYFLNVSSVDLFNCTISANSANSHGWTTEGNAIYNDNSTVRIQNSDLGGNTTIDASDAVYMSAGTLTLTNCLVRENTGHGVNVVGGTCRIASSTIANNSIYGVSCSAGSVLVTNSIVYGNISGGLTGAGSISAGYSCLQETRVGAGNIATNPLFMVGYYLSVSGLPGQSADSPCINAGTGNATDYGLDLRTTRTDGGGDAGTVDMGYHYASGVTAGVLANLTLYVDAVSGNNSNDGLSSGTAVKTLTEAFKRAVPGSVIHVAVGTYNAALGETFPLVIPQNGVTVVGAGPAASIIDAGAANRVLTASAQSFTLSSLTLQNGKITTIGSSGGGLYLNYCSAVLTNCFVLNNRIDSTDNGVGSTTVGGGIWAGGGSLSVQNCRVAGNFVRHNKVNQYGWHCYGGAIYAVNASVTLSGSSFDTNSLYMNLQYGNYETDYMPGINGSGGAVYSYGGSLQVTNCSMTSNTIYSYVPGQGPAVARGAAICLDSIAQATIQFSQFTYNAALADPTSDRGGFTDGGTMFITNSSLTLLNNAIISNRATVGYKGDVCVQGGCLGMTNCLVAANAGNGLTLAACTATVVNCTLANNTGGGLTNGAGTVTVRNCIAWGNTVNGITNATTVTYTDSQNLQAGIGNISSDPLFANAAGGDFHEKSEAGRWVGGGIWTNDAVHSPCIDAGDPADAYSIEPQPNGAQINMGRYGNTAQASLTRGPVALCNASGATSVTTNSATLNGILLYTNISPTFAWIYWGLSDGGTNWTAWGQTNYLGSTNVGAFSSHVSNLSVNARYYYRCFGSNVNGYAWAPETTNFLTVMLPAVDNASGATGIGGGSATLNGTLTSTGGAPTTVWICWGTGDGGTNKGSWANVVNLGVRGVGAFSSSANGLDYGTYYYRCCASNSAGEVWAGSTTSFFLPVDMTAWTYKMKIKFDGYNKAETLTNFPALVVFSNNMANGTFKYSQFAATNGGDLRFSDSNGTIVLNYEVESWATSTNSYIWVQVPGISGNGDYIWAYWGNASATNPPACTTNGSTWSNSYAGVWHMGKDPSGTVTDSTSNHFSTVQHGGMNSGSLLTAIAGDGLYFDGSDDYLNVPDIVIGGGPITISFWSRVNTAEKKDNWSFGSLDPDRINVHAPWSDGVLYWDYANDVNGQGRITTTCPLDIWAGIALVGANGRHQIMVNGASVASNSSSYVASQRTGMNIGWATGNTGPYGSWKGRVDEFRVSSVGRSPDWLWAEWMNQGSNNTFNVCDPVQNMSLGSVFSFK